MIGFTRSGLRVPCGDECSRQENDLATLFFLSHTAYKKDQHFAIYINPKCFIAPLA